MIDDDKLYKIYVEFCRHNLSENEAMEAIKAIGASTENAADIVIGWVLEVCDQKFKAM